MDGLAAPVKDKRNDYKDKKEYCNRQSNEPYKQGSYKHYAILRLWEDEVNPEGKAVMYYFLCQKQERGISMVTTTIKRRIPHDSESHN